MQKFRVLRACYVLVLMLYLHLGEVLAQSYSMQSFILGVFHQLDYGINGAGVSVCDINKDGWDDVAFCNSGAFPSIYINNGNGFDLLDAWAQIPYEIKQINWVDFDNDGDRDLTFTCYQGPMYIYAQTDSLVFEDVTASTGLDFDTYETYGASWSDYDRDGDLDVYIGNYNAPYFGDPTIENFLYQNNGDGTFNDVTAFAGVGNGATYTFSGIWMYANGDLWPDLFVSNDRYESSNALYINNGDGTFDDHSELAGVDYNILSMGVAIDDFDNDGDDDIYVADALDNLLLVNSNGVFQNMAAQQNVELNRFSWGTVFLDYDNDGRKDLYVATPIHYPNNGQNQLLRNTSTTFVNVTPQSGMFFDDDNSYGASIGDFNNDGFVDIVSLELMPSMSKIWINEPSEMNWLKVNLHGVESNRDAIGARITCFTSDEIQTQVVRCGESYLSQNTFTEHFGLSNANQVDSLQVEWPSGAVDKWYRIEVNQTVDLHEGAGFMAEIASLSNTTFCAGDSLSIQIIDQVSQVINWSNGSVDSELMVLHSDLWWARVQDQFNNVFYTNEIETFLLPSAPIQAEVIQPICAGQSGELVINNFDATWFFHVDDVPLLSPTLDLTAGSHELAWEDVYGCQHLMPIGIDFLSPIEIEKQVEHNLCFGTANGEIELQISGGIAPYTWLTGAEHLSNLPAALYYFHVVDSLGCAVFDTIQVNQYPAIDINLQWTEVSCTGASDAQVEFDVLGGAEPYLVSTSWLNDNALEAGTHSINVIDDNDCVASFDFEVVEPLPLIATLDVTNSMENEATGSAVISMEGGVEPYQFWWSNGTGNQPYAENLESGTYYIQVTDDNDCVLNTSLTIIDAIGVEEWTSPNDLFWPNPVLSILYVHPSISKIEIYAIAGQFIASESVFSNQVELNFLPSGIYFMRMFNQDVVVGAYCFSKQ